MIRRAKVADIPALLEIENASFTEDRFNRRRFHHLLTRGHAVTLVAADEHRRLLGYVNVLFSRGTYLARLYSLAVLPECRGRGLGRQLLDAAEQAARDEGAAYMRLEVRPDNAGAQELYHKAGYSDFAISRDYYDDGTDALRMEKSLFRHQVPSASRVPYYAQTLDFTCGPAALMMAMHALDPAFEISQKMELRLWRESTMVFMTSGHGGCGPYGLALVAHRLGFVVEVLVSQKGILFVDGVRSPTKRRVMELVQQDFVEQLRGTPVKIIHRRIGLPLLAESIGRGAVPVVLVGSYRLTRDKQPHWVVVTGFDEHFVFVHDPLVDPEDEKRSIDRMHIPILRRDFGRMARYGRARLEAALLLRKERQD